MSGVENRAKPVSGYPQTFGDVAPRTGVAGQVLGWGLRGDGRGGRAALGQQGAEIRRCHPEGSRVVRVDSAASTSG